MSDQTHHSSEMSLQKLEETLELYFVKKAPFQLPSEVKDAIVKFGPWVLLILMVLSLPVIIAALGLTAVFAPVTTGYGMMSGRNVFSFIPLILTVLSLVFNVIALPGLFNKTMKGWKNAFYAQLLSIASSLLSLQVGGAIISALIGFYILFQVKDRYK